MWTAQPTFWGDGDTQGRGCTPWAQRFRPEPRLTCAGGFQECDFASGQSNHPGAPRVSEGPPPLGSHGGTSGALPTAGVQAPDCTGTPPSLHRGSGSQTWAQPHVTGGFRALPTDLQSAACLCLQQHSRRCPCVSLLRALRVICLLTFAKDPRSPRLHTLKCVSHWGAWYTWSDSGLSGTGPETTFLTTLGAVGPGEQESQEGPLQRWALSPTPRQEGGKMGWLPTDLWPQTSALGAFQVCKGSQMPPDTQG